MEIKTLPLGFIGTNCYHILSDSAAVVIDPGFYSKETVGFLNGNKDKERLILITHSHYDHISGLKRTVSETGVKTAIGELDNKGLSDGNLNLAENFGASLEPMNADILLKDGEILTVGDISVSVMHTPGHTVGSVSYLIGANLFSGDTLFFESVGRTDFPGGDFSVLKNSVNRIYRLADGITVYPGHGEKTTVGYEKKNNPYI